METERSCVDTQTLWKAAPVEELLRIARDRRFSENFLGNVVRHRVDEIEGSYRTTREARDRYLVALDDIMNGRGDPVELAKAALHPR